MSTSGYLDGLVYRNDTEHRPEETKKGMPLFDGTPHHFEQWRLRAEGKIAAANMAERGKIAQELATLGSRLLDGLTGDAALIAQELGADKVICREGPERLIEKMAEELMGHRKDEARDLHRVGTK